MNLRSEVTLSELYANPSRNGIYKSAEFHGSGLKIVNMGELFGYDFISNQDMKRVQLTDKELENFSLQNGDLLFGRRSLVEAGAGKCSIVLGIEEPITFESSIIRVRLNNKMANPRFYFYYFKSPQGSGRIHSIVTGTNVKGIRGTELGKLKVLYLPITAQDTIVRILSAYDTIIENNRRRIQLLEQSARLLYREWFVYLRFPGHEHVRIIDGVPEGWRYDKLQKVADINAISLNNGFQGEIEYIDISSVTTGQINDTTFYDYDDAPSRARRVVRHGDIIWSCVRPNRESHAIIWHPHKNLITSTGFAVITPIKIPTSYIYQALTTKDFVGYLSNNARGVAYPAVTGKDFEAADILIPTHNLLEQFDEVVKPTIEQINVLNTHNEKLIEARDILLPRLMNGEITV